MPEDIGGRFVLMEAARVGRQVLWPHWPSGAARKTRVKPASMKQEENTALLEAA